ncbi:cytochrome P450 monooxygenase [Coniophora puteana RWD-64-598 SS2]|uniref:Cytochrome P450 monooxygenase n=1 Tax=Coniophora puteana (strain RWD-64-598) TaxID=741705 RepID=A0A5M3MH16_CONPW|nr:cytochrome P450 monooxygenase [Coniophora puteana RWD-64-598 SS2]EIW78240.1 cytochrome P450 monooxygenase [Coniophora puteana RWD-64-598 SS2]
MDSVIATLKDLVPINLNFDFDALLDRLRSISPSQLAAGVPVCLLLYFLVPWLWDPYHQRSIPGPFLAKFSNAWLGWVSAHGHRSEIVHELHKKYGPVVRIAPNHVSVADPEALQVVYAHGNGSLKSDFYDAFVSIHRGLFNTRDRQQHARKRKIVSGIFSQKNVLEFEPHVRLYVGQLMEQWDRLCARAEKGESGDEGEGGWQGRGGKLWLDCLPWYNYLAFDIIGDLAFGSPFGMIHSAKDSAPVAVSHADAMSAYGSSASNIKVVHIPAVQILNDRGEYSAAMGVLPPAIRPFMQRFVPWYRKGGKAVRNLAGIAVAAVAKRLNEPSDRVDLLRRLQEAKDDEGNPMGREELTAEALTQLIAGSDTTSNSSCAITYYLALHPEIQTKLQRELDDALGTDDDPVSTFDAVKRLPYLDSVINEALRLHSTSSIGLPRIAPEGGLALRGLWFPPGAILSVPSYTIHRDAGVWGADTEAFRPERWAEEERRDAVQRAFNPFSFGPRACVGRNLASMELLVIVSSILRRYTFVLEDAAKPFDTREGFLRKPVECRVGIRRRV